MIIDPGLLIYGEESLKEAKLRISISPWASREIFLGSEDQKLYSLEDEAHLIRDKELK